MKNELYLLEKDARKLAWKIEIFIEIKKFYRIRFYKYELLDTIY